MPPSRRFTSNPAPAQRGYLRLERQLALQAWLHRQVGYPDSRSLLEDIKPAAEGFDPDGRSYVYARLTARSGLPESIRNDLDRYDDNIRTHLGAMNAGRSEPITLRYFQYLAALYAEIYLDRFCNNRDALLRSLNGFVSQHSAGRYERFQAGDLSKLAFWMATGSGKTLLLHLNYRQFLHYNRLYSGAPLDNILLITPTEGLSQQHIGELQASNIPASRFNLNEPGSLLGGDGTVKVTEITKLVMEKRGEAQHRKERRLPDHPTVRARRPAAGPGYVAEAQRGLAGRAAPPGHRTAGNPEHLRPARQLHDPVPRLLGERGHRYGRDDNTAAAYTDQR